MSTFFARGDDAKRVAEYRKRAKEMFAQAAVAGPVMRASFTDIANSYLKLAQQVEAQATARALGAGALTPDKIKKSDHEPGQSES
jgi:hypothetical protein